MKTNSKIFSIINYFFFIIFLLGAAVQYNDPDVFVWILIYLAAAFAIILFQKKHKSSWFYSALVAAVCIIWAAFLAPDVFSADQFTVIFDEIEMRNVAIEQTREMLGLLIIAAWMIVLAILSYRRSRNTVVVKKLEEIIN